MHASRLHRQQGWSRGRGRSRGGCCPVRVGTLATGGAFPHCHSISLRSKLDSQLQCVQNLPEPFNPKLTLNMQQDRIISACQDRKWLCRQTRLHCQTQPMIDIGSAPSDIPSGTQADTSAGAHTGLPGEQVFTPSQSNEQIPPYLLPLLWCVRIISTWGCRQLGLFAVECGASPDWPGPRSRWLPAECFCRYLQCSFRTWIKVWQGQELVLAAVALIWDFEGCGGADSICEQRQHSCRLWQMVAKPLASLSSSRSSSSSSSSKGNGSLSHVLRLISTSARCGRQEENFAREQQVESVPNTWKQAQKRTVHSRRRQGAAEHAA